MFKVKAHIDYGLMIMLELAAHPHQNMSLSGLAKKLGVSSIYLIQISQSLTKADLIKSREGNKGGYQLARSARQISLLEIIEALEGKIELRCASLKKSGTPCTRGRSCPARYAWNFIIPDIKKTLNRRSLASLLKNTYEK